MNKKISVRIGIAGILLSVILLLMSPLYSHYLSEFVRLYITSDNILTPIGVAKVKLRLYFLIASIFLVGLFFAFDMYNKLIEKIPFQRVYDDIKRVFFVDPVCANKNMAKHFFITGSAIALLIQSSVVTFGEPEWEGTTDKYSPILFVVAAILLLAPIRSLYKLEVNRRIKNKIARVLVVLSILCLVLFGEEISWGQQFFEIETAPIFELNYQQENTIHNFFNPLFRSIYAFVGTTSFLLLTYFWLVSRSNGMMTSLFLPHISLFIFFVSMTGAVYDGESDELYEVYLAVLSVLYAVRLNICIKNPSTWFIQQANVHNLTQKVGKLSNPQIAENEPTFLNMDKPQ
jgi:hypothetical protein